MQKIARLRKKFKNFAKNLSKIRNSSNLVHKLSVYYIRYLQYYLNERNQ